MMRVVFNVFATILLFFSLPFCLFTIGAASVLKGPFGGLSAGGLYLQSLTISPFIVLAVYLISTQLLKRERVQRGSVAIWLLTGMNLFGVLALWSATASLPHGLWAYKRSMDYHFSNGPVEYHFFPPVVGWIGLFIVVAAYFSYRFWAIKNKPFNSFRACQNWLAFIPMGVYYLLIYVHRFIPQPGFIG